MVDVLIICEYSTLNGGERSMLSTLPHVIAAGFSVCVAAPPEGALVQELRRINVSHVPLDFSNAAGGRVAQNAARERLQNVLRGVQPHLVHSNSLSMSRLLGPIAADEGVPSIGHLRDIIRLSRQAMDDLNRNSRLIAVSHATREYHVANGLDANRTHVVHNGVDLAPFSADKHTESLRNRLNVDADALLVAMIGQVIARKGTDLFVSAAIEIVAKHRNAHFLIIGECYSCKDESRQFVANLHSTIDEHAARSNIHFLGFRGDVEKLLGQFDVIVQPSRQDPLSRVLLEAAAAGRAIVATEVGGTREIFPLESDAAVVVEPNNAAALTAAIDNLLSNAARRSELGINSRHRSEECFNVTRTAADLVRHYEELLAR
jgi:glycosyltransferase involved in cell wall biosynthesis